MNTQKKPSLLRIIFTLAVVLALSSTALQAEIRLPGVMGAHMVLQQDKPIQIWGWAFPGEKVTLSFAGRSAAAVADKEGNWSLTLDPMPANSESQVMTITGNRSPVVTLEDILIGEVWLCSGQSNMERALQQTHSPAAEIRRADFPGIRLFQVPRRVATHTQEDIDATWKVCRPETASNFSAVAYYFGRELHQKLKLPIGLIDSTWGGTRIEPWTPVAGFESVKELSSILSDIETGEKEFREGIKDYLPVLKAWLVQTEASLEKGGSVPKQPEMPSHPLAGPQQPTALYNGMIHPLIRYPIRGAIWYQGESNRNDGLIYTKKMEALISGWRKVWGAGDFPFYYVQLAPYNYPYDWEGTGGDIPDFYRLPLIWEAQRDALRIPNTGMAVITDIANLYDIHPRNKIEVGNRLALWARSRTYGEKELVYSGPLYKSMSIDGERARIRFDFVGGGLISLDGGPLRWFEISGQERVFYKAKAEMDGDTVLVWSPKVRKPVAVRFGWHQLAVPNLGNKAGLPASPFRTYR